jgi:hypothetical protein
VVQFHRKGWRIGAESRNPASFPKPSTLAAQASARMVIEIGKDCRVIVDVDAAALARGAALIQLRLSSRYRPIERWLVAFVVLLAKLPQVSVDKLSRKLRFLHDTPPVP